MSFVSIMYKLSFINKIDTY